jgi:hypothetical protein
MSNGCAIVFEVKNLELDKKLISLVNTFSDEIKYYYVNSITVETTKEELFKDIKKDTQSYIITPNNQLNKKSIHTRFKNSLRIVSFVISESDLDDTLKEIDIHFDLFKGEDGEDTYPIILKNMKKLIKSLDPQFAAAFTGSAIEERAGDLLEYNIDPYWFTIVTTNFKFSLTNKKEIDKIKGVMEPDEIKKFVKKYHGPFKLIEGTGIGLIKSNDCSYSSDEVKKRYVYPRYFIRKELRKRGLKLEDGLAEKYAKELGIK